MAPLPANNTIRYRVEQQGPRGSHKLLFRARDGSSIADLRAAVLTLLTAWLDILWDGTTFPSAQYSAEGSDFFLDDELWTGPGSGAGGAVNSTATLGLAANFCSRSLGGRRFNIYLYNAAINTTVDMRIEVGENADYTAAIAAWEAYCEDDATAAIDGLLIVQKNYINVVVNDYWTRVARRTL